MFVAILYFELKVENSISRKYDGARIFHLEYLYAYLHYLCKCQSHRCKSLIVTIKLEQGEHNALFYVCMHTHSTPNSLSSGQRNHVNTFFERGA